MLQVALNTYHIKAGCAQYVFGTALNTYIGKPDKKPSYAQYALNPTYKPKTIEIPFSVQWEYE
jgi:hypothetical protein